MAEKKPKSSLRENIEAIVIAIIIAMFIRTFIVQAFKIPSGSMLETLQIGDQILVNKFIYGVKIPFTDGKTLIPVKDPQKGDIVVFKYPEDPSKDFIKRVIAVGGDTLEIINKKLYVNDTLVEGEPYAVYKTNQVYPGMVSPRDNLRKITVPDNNLFVMGDNRDNSHDSRFWGFVDLKAVKGKAFIIYWSWNKNKFGVRWNRIGDILL
ncbi:signal peptidase I [Desulfobacula sp.]|uniref:signal peptidase I n=1 Tax=Desulfobacula sp. TaxID=2593537 RepID=UPI002615B690|nr:signal peptidase I [Desulfobacula sp.]